MKQFKPRWQEIKYSSKGSPFFTFKGQKHYLNDFMRTNFGTKGYLVVNGVTVHASKCMSIACNIGIQVSNCGEAVRAFWIEDIPSNPSKNLIEIV